MSTPQYSANRSIRNQHQKTFSDRGKLSRFFSGTISASPCTLPKKTCRDSNKKCEITPPSLGGGGPTRECFRVSCRRKVLPKSSPPSIGAFCPPPVWGGKEKSCSLKRAATQKCRNRDAKMVKNGGPGAFQQQSGSEEGPEAKEDPKRLKKKNVRDPFRVFFGTDF